MMTRVLALALAAVAAPLALPAEPGTYYVAPTGSPDNDGSVLSPWPSVQFALERVGGGNTIVLKPGFYQGQLRVSREYAGTPAAPTIIKSEVKWKAVLYGSLEHGVYVADNANYVVIDGFEVAGARLDGIKIAGHNGVVRNCWVHGANSMGISIHGKQYWTIENNLVEYNGQNVQFHHGIYADGQDYTLRNNIVRHNSGYGVQLYPDARRGVVTGNLIYGHTRKGGMVLQLKGTGRNVIANNTFTENALGINIYGGQGDVIVNNIFAGGPAIAKDSKTQALLVDYNLCSPACTQGTHGLEGDPMFVYASRGAFYLKDGSPAIGTGTKEFAPATDFWGRPVDPDLPVDIGAFPYVPYLTTSASRASWYSGYAYRYSPGSSSGEMPDLWVSPGQ